MTRHDELDRHTERPARDASGYRDALGQFPTGVCIITARAGDGTNIGMTVSSFNSLSLDPPLVIFSIDRRAFSLPQWLAAPGYAVNVLSDSQRALSDRFARPQSAKWSGIDYDHGHADAPCLSGVAACFECAAHACHDGGDHVVFIGKVICFRAHRERAPLIFCQRGYGTLRPASAPGEDDPGWPLGDHY